MQMQNRYRMGMHQRHMDDYEQEDYDEYEEEASEDEEDDEREEPVISKEAQEFLSLREKLKEKYRQKLKKEQTASAFGHPSIQNKKKTITNDNFGSFFGPSQPVIASRVIDESRSIRETQHIMSRGDASSTSGNVKRTVSTSSGQQLSRPHQQPKVVNEVKKKAQTLKDMRDYSFMFSDDADLPGSAKEEYQQPSPRKASAPNSDVRTAQASSKSRPPMTAKTASNGHGLKSAASKNIQSQNRVMPTKAATIGKPRPVPSDARKSAGGSAANGSTQRVSYKPLPSKHNVQSTSVNRPPARAISHPNLTKRPSIVPHPSAQKGHYIDQKKPSGGVDKVKTTMKQPMPSGRPSGVAKPQVQKKMPRRDIREERVKKEPARRGFGDDDDDIDEDDPLAALRRLTGYNPNKYRGMDEDDSDMEADFRTIQAEERRSAKIARKEDEEQLRLIEEEERRERMRKKQKLSRR